MYDASATQTSKNIGNSIKQTIDSGSEQYVHTIIYFISEISENA